MAAPSRRPLDLPAGAGRQKIRARALYWAGMIRISITAAPFDAVAATLPLGLAGVEREADAKGERHIWLEPRVLDRLKALRGPGESYSDVILRVARG